MKTAISIPDKTFAAAERLAKARGITRSELFRRALEEYLSKNRREWITEELNRVYKTEDSSLDPFFKELRSSGLRHADGDGDKAAGNADDQGGAAPDTRKRRSGRG